MKTILTLFVAHINLPWMAIVITVWSAPNYKGLDLAQQMQILHMHIQNIL